MASISKDQHQHDQRPRNGNQMENLRDQLEEGRGCHKLRVLELETRIEEHDTKIKAGHLPPKVERTFLDEKKYLQRQFEKANEQFEMAIGEIEELISEIEKELEETEKSRNSEGFFGRLISSSFLCVLASTGVSLELSESSNDFMTAFNSTNINMSDMQRDQMKELQRKYQTAVSSEQKHMEALSRKMTRAENIQNKIAAEGRLLRYVAPSICVFSAAFTVFRTMQSQLQVHKMLPVIVEMGSLSIPAILSYFLDQQ